MIRTISFRGLGLFLLFAFLVSIYLGSLDQMDLPRGWLMQVRLPRVLAGFSAGAMLAVSGFIFQTLFSNPLADPYVLGVSSMSGLFVVIALSLSSALSNLQLGFVGAFGGVLAAIAISSIAFLKRQNMSFVLIVGILLSLFSQSLLSLIYVFKDPAFAGTIQGWFFGDLSRPSLFGAIWMQAVLWLIFFVGSKRVEELDLLAFGESIARGQGLSIQAVRSKWILLGSLLVAFQVSQTGMIGFIGLLIPYFLKRRYGFFARDLLKANLILGGGIVMLLDAISLRVFYPYSISIGVWTALIGTPFFLFAIFKSSQNGEWS